MLREALTELIGRLQSAHLCFPAYASGMLREGCSAKTFARQSIVTCRLRGGLYPSQSHTCHLPRRFCGVRVRCVTGGIISFYRFSHKKANFLNCFVF